MRSQFTLAHTHRGLKPRPLRTLVASTSSSSRKTLPLFAACNPIVTVLPPSSKSVIPWLRINRQLLMADSLLGRFLRPQFWLHNLALTNVWHQIHTITNSHSSMSLFRMPKEGAAHQRTLMAFPHINSIGTQELKDLVGCRQEVANIANAIAKYEPVFLYARAEHTELAQSMVSPDVTVKEMPLDNLWIRDTGPVFVQGPSGDLVGVDFHFNFWGENAPETSDFDRTLAARILEDSGLERLSASLTAEGGGIEVDGEGTFMGTESSFMNPNRNKGMSKSQIEDGLRVTLGITKFIWFKGVRFFRGDVTDCHVDALARFGPNNTVILDRPNRWMSRDDPLYQVSAEAKAVLQRSTNAAGRPLSIVEIEQPPPLTDKAGNDIVMSYVNYLLVNGAVIVPKFGHEKTDVPAMETFKRIFPDRDIVPVFLHYLAREGGGIHCATQQWPDLSQL